MKELPHNNEAEQAILGALLIYPSVKNVVFDQGLEVDDFYLDIHKRIYNAMLYLMENNKQIDAMTLVSRLMDTEELQIAGGADYIVSLSDSAVTSVNVKDYITIVQKKASARRLIEVAEQIAEDGFGGKELDTLLDDAERSILDVTRNRKAESFKDSSSVVDNVMSELIALKDADNHITGIKTGYTALDKITNGFQRGDLIILAARPSMGKTALALNIALNAAERNRDGAVALFSLEMPAEQLMRRMLSSRSEVPGEKLRSGNLDDEEFGSIRDAANVMKYTPLYIDDSAIVKTSDIFSKCRKLKSEHGLNMVVIDYLQLISGSGTRNSDSRQQEVSDISRSLKALARELECPVIALSQLSRSVESRQDKRPMLSDLRESGAIEQDADIVMFIYRSDYYEKDEEKKAADPVISEIDIQKHRNGSTGTVKLQFHKKINAFYNIDPTR